MPYNLCLYLALCHWTNTGSRLQPPDSRDTLFTQLRLSLCLSLFSPSPFLQRAPSAFRAAAMSQAATATTAVTISPAAPAPHSSAESAHLSRQSYAIELYFDPALENQVLKAWNVLARRQISTQLIEIASRPHITLLSSSSLDPTRILPSLRSLASRLEPLPLSLSSIASLPNSGVGGALFLAPTPTTALLSLHAQMCETLRKEGVDASEDFRPDSWVPQCHVAVDVPRSRLGEAFCILRDLKLPVSGYAMDIGLVEFSPAEGSFSEIFSVPLGGEAEA